MTHSNIKILALSIVVASLIAPVMAGNSIGNHIAYIPLEEKSLHGLSENEWERIAGGEPPAELSRDFVNVPKSLKDTNVYKYSCKLPAGSVQANIQSLLLCLGFKGGVWMMTDFQLESETTFGGNTPEGVLQAVIEHFDLNGRAVIYANQMVAFKDQ